MCHNFHINTSLNYILSDNNFLFSLASNPTIKFTESSAFVHSFHAVSEKAKKSYTDYIFLSFFLAARGCLGPRLPGRLSDSHLP